MELAKVFQPADREELQAHLLQVLPAYEEGLRILGDRFCLDENGFLDILCLDRRGRLVVVEFELEEGDGLLERGLSHFSWVAENADNINKFMGRSWIDTSLLPRLLLIAHSFSDRLKRTIRYLDITSIQLLEYRYIEVKGERALLLEKVGGSEDRITSKPAAETRGKVEETLDVTDEEIEAFFEFGGILKNFSKGLG